MEIQQDNVHKVPRTEHSHAFVLHLFLTLVTLFPVFSLRASPSALVSAQGRAELKRLGWGRGRRHCGASLVLPSTLPGCARRPQEAEAGAGAGVPPGRHRELPRAGGPGKGPQRSQVQSL